MSRRPSRSITLPFIGVVKVVEDTRRLRRLLHPGSDGALRARIWFATVSRHRSRWVIVLNVETQTCTRDAAPKKRHRPGRLRRNRPRPSACWLSPPPMAPKWIDANLPDSLARALPSCAGEPTSGPQQPRSLNRRKADGRLNRIHARIRRPTPLRHPQGHYETGQDPRPALRGRPGGGQPRPRSPPRPNHRRRGVGRIVRQSPTSPPGMAARWRALPNGSHRRGSARTAGRSARLLICPSGIPLRHQRRRFGLIIAVTSMPRSALPPGRGRAPLGGQAPDPQAGGRASNACGRTGAGHRARGGATGSAIPQGRSRNPPALPHRQPDRTPRRR